MSYILKGGGGGGGKKVEIELHDHLIYRYLASAADRQFNRKMYLVIDWSQY